MGETLRQLKCEHCFHSECIVTWLKTRNSCPGCRGEAYTSTCERPDYSETVANLEMMLNYESDDEDDDDDEEEEDYYEEEEEEEEELEAPEQLEDGSFIVGYSKEGIIFARRPI